jgi:hypothetical protein
MREQVVASRRPFEDVEGNPAGTRSGRGNRT